MSRNALTVLTALLLACGAAMMLSACQNTPRQNPHANLLTSS
jgi:hypothetical protein